MVALVYALWYKSSTYNGFDDVCLGPARAMNCATKIPGLGHCVGDAVFLDNVKGQGHSSNSSRDTEIHTLASKQFLDSPVGFGFLQIISGESVFTGESHTNTTPTLPFASATTHGVMGCP